MPNYIDLWNHIKNSFENDDSMSKASFGAWVDTAEPISLDNHVMKIKVLSNLHRDYWTKHLMEKFVEYAYQFTDQDITPEFVTEDEFKAQQAQKPQSTDKSSSFSTEDTQLNSRYTFDTFVIGSGNQMAHAAAMAVSDEPGVLYNPLFFYGGVGLGKTHLMHAIGHQLLENDPQNSNIRELEGAMARIQAYAQLQNAAITTDLAADALRSLNFGSNLSHVTIPIIQDKVAKYFHVSVADLKGKKRLKSIVIPRQIAMYLSRELTDNSLPKIGTEFGGKDHTTVIHSCDKIKAALETNSDLARQIDDLKSELKP